MVRTEHDGPVTTVILERPERRNAVDRDTATALAEAFRSFEADPDARVAVLWGAGGTFCAGADLQAVAEGAPNRLEADGDGPMGPSRMVLSKPVLAAVAGYAVAGGLELACWCDLRIVEQSATFGVFCRRFGVPLIDGGTVRLPQLIGLSRALDLILTGRPIDADEALAYGLANRVVPDGTARAEAERIAHALAAFPQAALRADRASARASSHLAPHQALAAEFEGGRSALEEGFAGARAFRAGAGRGGRFSS